VPGAREDPILHVTADEGVALVGATVVIREHAAWQENRSRVREQSSAPSLRVVTATEYAMDPEQRAKGEEQRAHGGEQRAKREAQKADAVGQLDLFASRKPQPSAPETRAVPEVQVESVGIDFSRPHGKRFGILVHAVLSIVNLNAGEKEVHEVADLQGRLLGANQEEILAARETVTRALTHPLMKRAAAAFVTGRCRRETPIAMRLEDGTVVEGNVDLAFLDEAEPTQWMVVDFKTDFEIAGKLDEYREQVALYARAISAATTRSVKGVLFRI